MVARKGDPCPLVEDGKVCGEPARTRGWCGKHYARWRTYGDPLHPVRHYVPQGDKCEFEGGCENKPKRRGLCEKHVRRLLNHGETTDPRERRFWAQVDKNGPIPPHRIDLGPCWEWAGYIHKQTGYGQFGVRNGTRLAHRIAYQYVVGPIPPGKHIDHVCRNRKCVNALGHLEPVSARENIRRGDQGAFWGYVPDPIPPRAPKPVVCTKCSTTEKPVYKSGLCRPCYRKWLKDPDVVRPSKLTAEERFWAKVNRTDSCWFWTAGINRKTGYGRFAIRHGEMMDAHRFAYLLKHGAIPEGLDVHHTCHNRNCVFWGHLQALSRAENMRLRKNRRD